MFRGGLLHQVSPFYFLLSQSIYTVGSYAIMSSLFQLKIKRHLPKIIVLSIFISLINYVAYFNHSLHTGFLVPIIGVLVSILYLAVIVRVPLIWSLISTVTGNVVITLVIQLAILVASFGFFSPMKATIFLEF